MERYWCGEMSRRICKICATGWRIQLKLQTSTTVFQTNLTNQTWGSQGLLQISYVLNHAHKQLSLKIFTNLFPSRNMANMDGALVDLAQKQDGSRRLTFGMDTYWKILWPVFKMLLTLWRRLGRRWPTRIDLWIDPISPCRWRFSAGLHATDTLRHAYIDFLTYSGDHPSR